MMNLTPHFSLDEMTLSDTALRLGIVNDPTQADVSNLRRLASMMESVRVMLGSAPITINSGYRSKRLNTALGGALNSAHMTGRACDFTCSGYGTPIEICRRLSDSGLSFDKLIMEGTWVHIQIPESSEKPRRIVLTARFSGGIATYSEGLT